MMPLSPSETFRAAFSAARRVLLTGPLDPDGDSLGACLALARGVAGISEATVDVAGTPSFRYRWMPGADRMVPDERIAGPYDVAVVLDGDRHRLPAPVGVAYEAAAVRGLVDHHASTDPGGYDIALLDPRAASATELVHQMLKDWSVAVDRDLAALLYTGLIFDTGGFRYSNTRPSTHRLAAELLETGLDHSSITAAVLMERRPGGLRLLGRVLDRAIYGADGAVVVGSVSQADLRAFDAAEADIEGIVDMLLFTKGVEIAVLAIEKPSGQVKLSLRSRTWVNVARIASSLSPGGGGHARAAGVTLDQPMDRALAGLVPLLSAAVQTGPSA